MDFIASMDSVRWGALVLSALLIGLNKSGLDGGTLIAIPILALFFGTRPSSGLLLGILVVADITAALNYRKQCDLKHLTRTLPWALAGVVLGSTIGGAISDVLFRGLITMFILVSALLMTIKLIRGADWRLPNKWWAAAPLGLLAGFSSMVGNAAGPVMGLYLISSGLEKTTIIGTSVIFFLLINLVKLPFHLFMWKTLSAGPLLADAIVAPITVAATLAGVRIVRVIPDKAYKFFLILMAAVGGIYLALR